MGKLNNCIYLFGFYQLSYPLFQYFVHLYNNQYREENNDTPNEKRISQLYNKTNNKWALVTGASEGIGRAFALDLSRAGFNVMIASRSAQKLQSVSSDIKTVNQDSQVEVVPIDLSKNDFLAITQNSEVMNNLAIVVNNAGQLDAAKFLDQNPEKIFTQHKLNIYAITFLTKFQITNWLKIRRINERCAVIQLSSSGSDMPVPQLSHYAATKRYDDIFAQLTNQILKESRQFNTIDTLIVKPGLVTTSMTKNAKVPYFSCYPEQTSRDSLKELGISLSTYGSILHNFQKAQFNYIPTFIKHQMRMKIGSHTKSIESFLPK